MARISVTDRDEDLTRQPHKVREVKVVKSAGPPTRHRPAPRTVPVKPTRLQRQAEKELREGELGPPARKGKGNRKKSLAHRASHKIKPKHKVWRAVTWVVVWTAVGAGKTVKWTAIGTGKASAWSGRRLAAKVTNDVHRRKWVPEAERPAGTRWFQRVQSLECCGKHFHTIEGLNHHAVTAHRGEARQYAKATPKIQRSHRRVTEGKVIVRPEGSGGGRHRARHHLPQAQRVDAIIAAHRDHLTKIGEAAMATDQAAAALKRAAQNLSTSDKPEDLKELRDLCTGMERAFGTYSDAVSDWARMLMRQADPGDRRGANIDPALVRPFEKAIKEHLDAAGREFTRFVVAFDEFYLPEIRAARKKTTPNIDLSKTG